MKESMRYVNILRESLERKKQYLDTILEYTVEQGKLAHAESFDENAFSRLVEGKEVLINNINEIDKGFTSVYDRVRSQVLDNPAEYADELKKIQQLIQQCIDLGMKIEACEQRNRGALEQALSSGLRNIRKVKQSKKIVNQYYRSMANGAVDDMVFYDKKK